MFVMGIMTVTALLSFVDAGCKTPCEKDFECPALCEEDRKTCLT